MVGRKPRMSLTPSIEPMETRQVRSGLLIALAANVPHLSQAQVGTVASGLATNANSQVSVKAVPATNANGV